MLQTQEKTGPVNVGVNPGLHIQGTSKPFGAWVEFAGHC